MSTSVFPMPTIGRKIARSARLGRARPRFEMLIARNENRWMCPRNTPSGRPMTIAMPTASAEIARCWTSACSTTSARSAMKLNASTNGLLIGSRRPPGGRPWREHALQTHEQGVSEEREEDAQHARRDELRVEVTPVERVEDRLAEPLRHDERRDGCQRD